MIKTGFLLVVIFLIAFSDTGATQEKIRVGIGSVSLQSVLPFIGKQRGLFAKYNLVPEIVYIPGGSTNVQALISGNLDISQLSGAPGAAAGPGRAAGRETRDLRCPRGLAHRRTHRRRRVRHAA